MRLQTKYILALPLLIFLISLIVFPMAYLWFLSFNNVTFVDLSPSFVGLNNFYSALTSIRGILGPIFFSFKYALISVIIQVPLAIGFALLFNRKFRGKNFFIIIILLPIFTSRVLLGIMGKLMFQEGIGTAAFFVNSVLKPFGLSVSLLSPEFALWSLIILDSILWTPFIFLFVYVALQSLPKEYIEAAAIDGASPGKRFWTIVFPLLSPTAFFLIVMNLVYAFFETFGVIHAITEGGPNEATNIMVYKVYHDGFLSLDLGGSAAQSVILMAIVISLTVVQFRYIERRVHY